MKSRAPIVVMALAAVFLVLGIAIYFATKDRYDWTETEWTNKSYDMDNAEPYGAQVFRRMLDEFFNGQLVKNLESLPETLPDSSHTGENYVFIGSGFHLDSANLAHLLRFIRAGNNALIISKSVPATLMRPISGYPAVCSEDWINHAAHHSGLEVRASLRSPDPDSNYLAHFAIQNESRPYSWNYINSDNFCAGSEAYPIGYLNSEMINFAHFQYGEGSLFLHSNPLLFSNYSLTKPQMQRYAAAVLSHLPNAPTYFDTKHRVAERTSRRRNGDITDPPPHLLSFLLQKPALAWAWQLLAGLTLLWLIFRAKRRFTAIPVLPQKENTSYEFINIIAHLHFKSGDFRGLSIQMMKLFCTTVRERYNLTMMVDPSSQQLKVEAHTIKELAMVSGVPEQRVLELTQLYYDTVQLDPSQNMAIALHKGLESFWKAAR
jgi:hypothetical protein